MEYCARNLSRRDQHQSLKHPLQYLKTGNSNIELSEIMTRCNIHCFCYLNEIEKFVHKIFAKSLLPLQRALASKLLN